MRDITEYINRAISQNTLWSIDLFYTVIGLLRDKDIEVSYWDHEENWAILISDKKQ